ncbi:hypothetical protein TruAng_010796 [Truncatella angustata]|nr:hypothetical protein TruAng_010796 [Truncatella angustata]
MQPKLLTIIIGSDGDSKVKSDVTQWSPHKNPVALGICTESRARALLRYTMKVPIYRWHGLSVRNEARRYIDPKHDLVLILPTADTARRHEYNFLGKDLDTLLNCTLKKIELDQKGKRRFAQAIQRLAIPSRWWRDRFSNKAMRAFAVTCFAIPREIYLVEEIASEQQDGDAQVAECSGNINSAMPESVKRRWQEPGWSVEYQEHAIKVVRPDSTIVRVRDLYHTSLAGMDLSAYEASETTMGAYFQRSDPNVHYEENIRGHNRPLWPAPFPERVIARNKKE